MKFTLAIRAFFRSHRSASAESAYSTDRRQLLTFVRPDRELEAIAAVDIGPLLWTGAPRPPRREKNGLETSGAPAAR